MGAMDTPKNSSHRTQSTEQRQFALFEVRLVALDKPTDRRRWNGGPLASKDADEALSRAVDAFRASIMGDGFTVVRTGYGVSAEDR